MLKVKDAYDHRADLCRELRSGKHVQSYGSPDNWPEKTSCALGIMSKFDPQIHWYRYGLYTLKLTEKQIQTIISMNDGTDGSQRHSFTEIANYLESLP